MNLALGDPSAAPAPIARLGWTPRRRVAVATVAALVWAIGRAGVGDEIVNGNGWSSFARFWESVTTPDTSAEFLRLTVDAAATTLAYAVLGTALSLVIGAFGSLLLSQTFMDRAVVRRVSRVVYVVPRAVHEILWALLFVQFLGFDPLVAVLAIGIPFGAVTAKVYAETVDAADPAAFRRLRAQGASRVSALAYGILPTIRGDLVSYAFYRLECAIRAAAVLGVIGAGGLGFQLDLSFESLNYDEIWTLIFALMILSGVADFWSSSVRRSSTAALGRVSIAAVAVMVPLAWWWTDLQLSALWSPRTRRLFGEVMADIFPPTLGPGGWPTLIEASVDTVAMSVLAIAIAGVGGLVFATLSSRPMGRTVRVTLVGTLGRLLLRLVLLLFRAVPAPVWAFLFVLVLFPGIWPGAVALGVYNLGVLGRLFAEAFEERDTSASDALVVSGASRGQTFGYATLPAAAPRLVSLALYRWEVIVRETVVVGVVGAGGLGQLIRDHLAARDFAAVTGAIVALVVISLAIDALSGALRRILT